MAARLTKTRTSTPELTGPRLGATANGEASTRKGEGVNVRRAAALAARRRTLFPLSPREVLAERAMLAAMLRGDDFSFYAIRQVLKCSGPDEARRLVARGNRIWRTPV